MRSIVLIQFLLFSFAACASTPKPTIHEYILDPKAQKLVGYQASDDLPMSQCEINTCYVYKDEDLRKIKKYISELESRLESSEKKTGE